MGEVTVGLGKMLLNAIHGSNLKDRPRHSDAIPKHKRHKSDCVVFQKMGSVVQKMQGVVQKMQVNQSFSFVLLLKQETNVKESSHEKVRSMPWKAGIRCPLP